MRLERRGGANSRRRWPSFGEEPVVLGVARRRQRRRGRVRTSRISREAYVRNL